MSVAKVITFFSMFTRLPVYAEDVRDHIIELGIQDEIYFEPMDAPPGCLMGMFVRYRERQAPYRTCANKAIIFYNKNVTPDEQNFICCKELMHVFDDVIVTDHRRGEFISLIDYLFKDDRAHDRPTVSGFLDDLWSMEDVVALIDAQTPSSKPRGPYKSRAISN